MRASLPLAMVPLVCASMLSGCGALVTLQTLLDGDGAPPPDGGPLAHDAGALEDAGSGDGGGSDDDEDGGIHEGGIDDDGGPLDGGPCGTVSMLADPLDVVSGGPFVEVETGGAALQSTGGQFRVSLPSAAAFAGAASRWRTSLFGDGVVLEMAALLQATGVSIVLQLNEDVDSVPSQAAIRLLYTGGTVYSAVIDEDGGTTVSGGPLVTATHRFWRIRAPDAERVIVEVAKSEAGPFTQLLATNAPAYLAHAHVAFGALSDGTNESVTIAFAQVSGLLAAPAWCPAAELVDDFSATPLSRRWQGAEETNCEVSLSGGRLRFTQQGSGSFNCAIGSSTPVSLAGSSLQATIGLRPATTGTFTGLHVRGGVDLGVWIGVREGGVVGTFEGTVNDSYVLQSSTEVPPASDPVLVRLLFDDAMQVAIFQQREPAGSWTTFWEYNLLPVLEDPRVHLRMVNFAGSNVLTDTGEIEDVNLVE